MPEQFNSAMEFFNTVWIQLVDILPRIIAAGLLLIAGWLAARFIRRVLIRIMKLLRLDAAAERAGIEDFLLHGNVKYTTVTIIANVLYWLLMFSLMLAVLNTLGMRTADELFAKIILYIPNVIVAILVLIFGSLLARFFRDITFTYLSNVGISGAEFVSHLAQWALLFFVVSVALEQLSIGGQLLISAFQIAFGALCLALALAFGLGGREWASRILEKFWSNGEKNDH